MKSTIITVRYSIFSKPHITILVSEDSLEPSLMSNRPVFESPEAWSRTENFTSAIRPALILSWFTKIVSTYFWRVVCVKKRLKKRKKMENIDQQKKSSRPPTGSSSSSSRVDFTIEKKKVFLIKSFFNNGEFLDGKITPVNEEKKKTTRSSSNDLKCFQYV